MKLSIDEALQKGIKAHKAGQVKEADQFYTAILNAQPKHPDANHNMGVLAVGIGKVEAALPFFKTALEANPKIAQFWLSYIDALIKLDRLTDAKAALDQAKSKGAKGDGFDKLEARLSEANKEYSLNTPRDERLETNQSGTLDIAIQLRETGKFTQAIDLLKDETSQFPEDPNILAVLSHCYLLADRVEEAKLYLNKARKLASDNALVQWNIARLALQEKNPLEALNIARNTCQKFPDDVEGMGVLGTCLRATNEIVESLDVLNKALKINPDYAEALINRGLIRLSQENKSGAIADLEMAHRLKPHIKQIWDLVIGLKVEAQKYSDAIQLLTGMIEIDPENEKLLATVALCYQHLKDFKASEEFYNKALALEPDFVEAVINLGSTLKEQGKLEEAVNAYKKAIDMKPDYADAYYNMGNALQEQGHLEEAIEAYKKAQDIKPDFAEAYNNMGNAHQDQGKLEQAIELYNNALSIKPDYAEAYNNMGNALRGFRFTKANQQIEDVIVSILERKSIVRPKNISRAALSLIKCKPKFEDFFSSDKSIVAADTFEEIKELIARTPLLLKLMSVCPLPDLDFERMLRELRSFIVRNIADITVDSRLLKVQTALALQCFTNEYVYELNENDAEALHKLEEVVFNILANGSQPKPHIVLCLASFTALHQYEWSTRLQSNHEIKDVIKRQITEPHEEQTLKANIRVLGEINDEVSSKVREQYEENPYPRWVNLGLSLKPASISDASNEIKLRLSNEDILSIDTPNVLIAGCGTGQHSIGTASRFQNSKVLAIDLSLSSLAYAKRKTQELGIQNIEYMQADILQLRSLGRQFDIIESAGVLHHMNYPIVGWEVLVDCLRPGGLMKVGLYSELARKPVVDYRSTIAEAALGPTEDNIRYLRATIAESEDESSKLIKSWQDYFSMSELRDLLFHVREHRFTIPHLKDCLSKLGLEFCGFEAKNIVAAFKISNPRKDAEYDLDEWSTFEKDNPRIFAGMYQFWCQKIT